MGESLVYRLFLNKAIRTWGAWGQDGGILREATPAELAALTGLALPWPLQAICGVNQWMKD